MIQTATIIKASSSHLMIEHIAIMIKEGNEYIVYDNTDLTVNDFGGNLHRNKLVDFLKIREIYETTDVQIDTNKFRAFYEANKHREYNTLFWNCETFINKALFDLNGSPQLVEWSIKGTIALTIIGLWISRKIKNGH